MSVTISESKPRDLELTPQQERMEITWDIVEGEFIIKQMNILLSEKNLASLDQEEIDIFKQIRANAERFVEKKLSEIKQFGDINDKEFRDNKAAILRIMRSLIISEVKQICIYYGNNPDLSQRYLTKGVIADLNDVRQELTPDSKLIRTTTHRIDGIMVQ